MIRPLVCWLLFLRGTLSSHNVFSVNDDVFAYPQYEIEFSSSYVLEDDASSRVEASRNRVTNEGLSAADEPSEEDVDYEQLILHERRYLCSIPHVKPVNTTEEVPSKDDRDKELVKAADRGWQLLQDMEGKQCLYYSTGWWSYAFCYNSHVKQFHALPPGPGGSRSWPPVEDQTTPSYVLGKYEVKSAGQETSTTSTPKPVTGLQTRADGNYLVQRFEGGSPCDLTGKARRVEIEFHCNPQTTDRIGWIKETTICSYLMVVYTPRLCNDIAFQPPRGAQAHVVKCQEILSISEAAHLSDGEQDATAIEQSEEKPVMIGNIELGARKLMGKDGKKLEKGRIVMKDEERTEVIMMRKNGEVQGPSKKKMKEHNLHAEDIDDFHKELQKIAGSNDWSIEVFQDVNGQIQLRGIVATDGNGGEEHYEAVKEEEKSKESKEKRKDEL